MYKKHRVHDFDFAEQKNFQDWYKIYHDKRISKYIKSHWIQVYTSQRFKAVNKVLSPYLSSEIIMRRMPNIGRFIGIYKCILFEKPIFSTSRGVLPYGFYIDVRHTSSHCSLEIRMRLLIQFALNIQYGINIKFSLCFTKCVI